MRQQKHSIDGFVPRRPSSQVGGQVNSRAATASGSTGLVARTPVAAAAGASASVLTRTDHGLARRDIDDSLRDIDTQPRTGRKDAKPGKRLTRQKLRHIIVWSVVALLAAALVGGGWVAFKALHAGSNVLKGNLLDVLQHAPLQQDANGRTNILLFGTSEDDPGHDGAYLTDSIMVLSVDQKNKNAYMFNLPRDLEVKYGTACASGYAGKINVVYSCHYNNGKDEDAGAAALQQTVADVTGLDMQYYVHVNYSVVRDAVNAVGGVTVDIQSRDPRGQMDSNFDWKCWAGAKRYPGLATIKKNCPPNGHFIDYPNGPANLDAEHALYLAQARGDSAPTYGFEQSNFDREKNQQKIVKAIRDKALSAGTLSDIGKVSALLDAFGNNLRTNFQAKEMQTLVSLAKDIPNDKIQTISLIDGDTPVMNGDGNPAAGKYDYTGVQSFLAKKLSSNPVSQEGASVVVLNGTGISGVAQTEADKLTKQGFTVTNVANAPSGDYGKATIYQVGSGKPATKAKLESIYGVTTKTTTPPVTVSGNTDFVVIIGQTTSSQSQ